MSIIDSFAPTFSQPNVEDYFKNNKGFLVLKIDDKYEIKELYIKEITLVYGINQEKGIIDKLITNFSFEENIEIKKRFLFQKKILNKKVTKKIKSELFSEDYYSTYLPKNYLELEDVGINKKDAFDRYFKNESRYLNYIELFYK